MSVVCQRGVEGSLIKNPNNIVVEVIVISQYEWVILVIT